jgi:formate/nitrite transporter
MSVEDKTRVNVDCRNPSQTANYIMKEMVVAKAGSSFLKVLTLGIMAGVFIGFGGEISTLAGHDGSTFAGYGVTRVLAGAVFSLGLMLVVIAGAELFTGNTLIFGAVLEKKVSVKTLLKNWLWVYSANFIGSVLLACLVFYSNTWQQNDFSVGAYALKIGVTKVNLTSVEILTRGILCNCLVCLAIWMSSASRNVVGKILAIFFPIMSFVALGYEHCVANMFFIPKAMFLAKIPEVVAASHLTPEKLAHLNMFGFTRNLFFATLGNVIGSVGFLVTFYWLAYVKEKKSTGSPEVELV